MLYPLNTVNQIMSEKKLSEIRETHNDTVSGSRIYNNICTDCEIFYIPIKDRLGLPDSINI